MIDLNFKDKKFIVDGRILFLIDSMFRKLDETEKDVDKVLWVQLGRLAEAYYSGYYIKEFKTLKKGDEDC